MRVAGSFAIIAVCLLVIENVISRDQRRNGNIEKEAQREEKEV